MKVLILRFSSFGDIVQASEAAWAIKKQNPLAIIHWCAKEEFVSLIESLGVIDRVIPWRKGSTPSDLIELCRLIKQERYSLIYDAHKSLRTSLMSLLIRPSYSGQWVSRSKQRLKRLLLFKFRIKLLSEPFVGAQSYLAPLIEKFILPPDLRPQTQAWSFSSEARLKISGLLQKSSGPFVVLCPATAWPMKTWPLENWKKLIELSPEVSFVILGGPQDHFCSDIAQIAPQRALDLHGKCSLLESCAIISQASLVIAADTGAMHVSDTLGTSTLALIGPTAFGFPGRSNSETLAVNLPCMPCTKDGRGKCSQDVFQKCMVMITPERVTAKINQTLESI